MSVEARCLVGGCGWTASNRSSVRLTALAEQHRRLAHVWVKPGRCHELTDPDPPVQVEVPARVGVKPGRLRGNYRGGD